MLPALVTQFIVLLKDTSLASIIGYVDLTKAAQIVNNREIRPFELYLFIAVVYWLCSYSMSRCARSLEYRLSPSRGEKSTKNGKRSLFVTFAFNSSHVRGLCFTSRIPRLIKSSRSPKSTKPLRMR